MKALTAADGTYRITGLPPEAYRIEVESAGFKRTSAQNVELGGTGTTAVNLTLEPGNVNDVVEIKGTSAATQQETGGIGAGIGTRQVRELPVIDRNAHQLAELQSGITPPYMANPSSRSGTQPLLCGERAESVR
jgi:hypothetical protein